MKRVLVMLVAVVFTIAVTGLSMAADLTGTITKIEDGKITVITAGGQKTTAAGDVNGLRVGQKVTIEDGKVVKKHPNSILR